MAQLIIAEVTGDEPRLAFRKNMSPKNAPEMMASRFPSACSNERLSRKNTTMPLSAITITNTLRAGGTRRCSMAS